PVLRAPSPRRIRQARQPARVPAARYSERRYPSQLIHGSREDRLEGLGIFRLAPARLAAGIAPELVSAVFRDIGVILPQMLLAFHALDGRLLLLPYRRDVQDRVRFPAALLCLMRLEEVKLR